MMEELVRAMEHLAECPGPACSLGNGTRATKLRRLKALAKNLEVKRNGPISERLQSAEETIRRGGGDIEDVLIALAAVCRHEGIEARIQHMDRIENQPGSGRIWLEARFGSPRGAAWKQLGPEGAW